MYGLKQIDFTEIELVDGRALDTLQQRAVDPERRRRFQRGAQEPGALRSQHWRVGASSAPGITPGRARMPRTSGSRHASCSRSKYLCVIRWHGPDEPSRKWLWHGNLDRGGRHTSAPADTIRQLTFNQRVSLADL